MPISIPKKIKCKNCKKTFVVMIGDMGPQKVVCPHCKFFWLYTEG